MKLLPFFAVATFAAGLAMLAVGYFYGGESKPKPVHVDYFTPAPTAFASPTETPTNAPTPTPTPPPYDGAVARFKIPRFNVDAAVEDIGIKAGTNELDTPHDPVDVGWYGIYAKPGFGSNAVFSAHVDYYGRPPSQMPFNRLKELNPNDEVDVVMDNGTAYKYRVILKQNYSLTDIKMGELIDAPEKPKDAEWITLITCGDTGPFVYVNGGNSGPVEYLTRDVVIAERFE